MQGTRKLCKKYMSQCKMPKCIKENRFCGLQQARYLPCKCKCKAAFHSSQESSTHSWAIYFLPRHQQKRKVLGYTLFTADVPPVVWGGGTVNTVCRLTSKRRLRTASLQHQYGTLFFSDQGCLFRSPKESQLLLPTHSGVNLRHSRRYHHDLPPVHGVLFNGVAVQVDRR